MRVKANEGLPLECAGVGSNSWPERDHHELIRPRDVHPMYRLWDIKCEETH